MSQSASNLSAEERLKARKPVPKPVPAYLPTAGSPLSVDKNLSGRAWEAPAGSIVSISTPEGPQVGMWRIFSFISTSHHIEKQHEIVYISVS